MMPGAKLRRDQSGAAVVEMALALPVLILMIWGIFQVGILFQANSGMQHALGEGARYATIWPTPTKAQIKSRIGNEVFGTGNGTFTVADPVDGSGSGGGGGDDDDEGGGSAPSGALTLRVTYSMPMNFLFFQGPTVTLTRTKKVYIAS